MTRMLETLADGGAFFESPRWHDGRWYVSDILGGLVCAFGQDGRREDLVRVVAQPSGLGWLPDGSLLVVSMRDRRILRVAGGVVETHADLADLSRYDLNDMVVDTTGRAWVGMVGFDAATGEAPRAGALCRVDPDGAAAVVAEDLWCPNGLVTDGGTLIVAETLAARLTAFDIYDSSLSARRVFAKIGDPPAPGTMTEMFDSLAFAPDGCDVDVAGFLWVADSANARCTRISPDGVVVDEIAVTGGRTVAACALGGADGRTLLICAVPPLAATGASPGSVLLTTRVDVPSAREG